MPVTVLSMSYYDVKINSWGHIRIRKRRPLPKVVEVQTLAGIWSRFHLLKYKNKIKLIKDFLLAEDGCKGLHFPTHRQIHHPHPQNKPPSVNLVHGEADSGRSHELVPVPGPYGRVLELRHGPKGDEKVLHFAIQTCEGFPRSNLSETQAWD